MAKRTKSQQIGQKASVAALELLIDGGCAVNSLERDDVGFDLHVVLPTAPPVPGARSWSMSSCSILVQVKGGRSVTKGVKLTRERWAEYLTQREPTYIAAVPPKAGARWIASVYELFPYGIDDFTAGIPPAYPPDPRWDPEILVKDALINAGIPTPADRLWWQAQLPRIEQDDETQALNILNSLVDLSILHVAAIGNGAPVDLSGAQDFAAEIVNASVETNKLLTKQGKFDGYQFHDLDLGDSSRLMSDTTLEWNSLNDAFRLAALSASQPVKIAWGQVELKLLQR